AGVPRQLLKGWRIELAATMKLGRSPLVSLDHGEGTEGIEPERLDDVVAARAELGNVPDAREPALSAAPGQHGDQIDGLRDQRPRDGHDRLLHQLLETSQRADRGRRMDRADAAGMPRAPGLQQIERLATPHLANRAAIGPAPE